MSKKPKELKPEEKIAQGKKASKAVDKKKAKNKIASEAKKLSDKMILDIAAELPAGQGNAFVQLNIKMDKLQEQKAALNKAIAGCRNEFKAIKTDMRCLDRVRKLRAMDIEDVRATKATEALYEKQLGMALSPEQEAVVREIEVKRENARAAMSNLSGGETGKEVGSGTESPIGHNSNAKGDQAEEKVTALPTLPERNEAIGKGFRKPEPVASTTH